MPEAASPEIVEPAIPLEAAVESAEPLSEPALPEPSEEPAEAPVEAPAEEGVDETADLEPAEPEEAPDEAAVLEADETAIELASEELDEAEDEDGGWEDEDDDLDAPDPFISGASAEPEAVDADLENRRVAARAEALAGEQRIYLSMPAGPGSLAEALNELSAEGLVEATFVDDDGDEPYILYRPVQPA